MPEDSVGALLLERTSRSAALTAARTALYKDALKLLKLVDAAVTHARSIAGGDVDRVAVGYTAVAGYRLLRPASHCCEPQTDIGRFPWR
jgi:DNA-binding transcriptional LysR family regulator